MDVRLPNGKIVKNVPEDITRAQLLDQAVRNNLITREEAGMSASAPAPTKPQVQAPQANVAPQPQAGMMEQMFGTGSPTYSLLRGAVVEPILGVNQMLANSGLFGDAISQGANQMVQRERAAYEEGQRRTGRTGFDVTQLAGAVLSPINKLLPASTATTVSGKIAQGAAGGSLFAGMMPTAGTEENYLSDKLFQIGLGGLIGGAIPLTTITAGGISDFLKSLPVTAGNKKAALQDYIANLTGDKKAEAVAALRNAGQIVKGSNPTAAEALAEVPSAIGLVKEQQRLTRTTDTAVPFLERSKDQAAARKKSLTDTFGTDTDLAAAKALRESETKALREEALSQANVAGKVEPQLLADIAAKERAVLENYKGKLGAQWEEAQAIQRANTWTPVPGYPRFPARYSPNYDLAKSLVGAKQEFTSGVAQRTAELNFKRMQLKSVRDEGFYPLETAPLLTNIDQRMSTVGERSNAMLVSSLAKMRDKLASFTDENGIINSVDLYNVRKEIADDIRGFIAEKNIPSFGAQAANVETSLKKMLDASINKASGTELWTQYLSKFTDHSRKINQMGIGQEIADKLTLNINDVEKVGVFANAVNNAASLIKRNTGAQRYEKLSDILTPEQTKVIDNVYADLSRKAKSETAARQVRESQPNMLSGAQNIPSFFSAKITAAKTILEGLRRGGQTQLDRNVAELLLDPVKLADFIDAIPKKDAPSIAEAIMAKLPDNTRRAFAEHLSLAPTGQQTVRAGIGQAMNRPTEPE